MSDYLHTLSTFDWTLLELHALQQQDCALGKHERSLAHHARPALACTPNTACLS